MDLITLNENGFLLNENAEQNLIAYERLAKWAKEHEDTLKAEIIKEMEKKGILKVETEEVTVKYVAATSKETFDSKKLRKDSPDIYDKYVRITPVKASVRVKVKQGEERRV